MEKCTENAVPWNRYRFRFRPTFLVHRKRTVAIAFARRPLSAAFHMAERAEMMEVGTTKVVLRYQILVVVERSSLTFVRPSERKKYQMTRFS